VRRRAIPDARSWELLAHRALFDCSPLAAMFAELPPSSSDLSERKALFRHLLLHTARPWGWCSLRSRNLWEDRRREHRESAVTR
jgi:hypothetical protein